MSKINLNTINLNGSSGGGSADDVVKYSESQSLTNVQKVQARENLGLYAEKADLITTDTIEAVNETFGTIVKIADLADGATVDDLVGTAASVFYDGAFHHYATLGTDDIIEVIAGKLWSLQVGLVATEDIDNVTVSYYSGPVPKGIWLMKAVDYYSHFLFEAPSPIFAVPGTQIINPIDFKYILANTISEEQKAEMGITNGSDGFKDITYSELKALRDDGELVPGVQYRITDYHTTTIQNKLNAPTDMDADTISADHQFDIIVTALSNNTLDESARCCLHEGDTYFTNYGARLEKWEIKYSLDNDWKYCWSKVDAFTDSDGNRYQRIRFMDNVVEGVKYYAYINVSEYHIDTLFFTQEIKESGTYTHYHT